jgi:hypothetical protein
MVYLNFTDLSEETQNRLLENSKKDVERKFGNSIRKYVKENYTCFETMIEEACPERSRREALRNLYSYKYVFNI